MENSPPLSSCLSQLLIREAHFFTAVSSPESISPPSCSRSQNAKETFLKDSIYFLPGRGRRSEGACNGPAARTTDVKMRPSWVSCAAVCQTSLGSLWGLPHTLSGVKSKAERVRAVLFLTMAGVGEVALQKGHGGRQGLSWIPIAPVPKDVELTRGTLNPIFVYPTTCPELDPGSAAPKGERKMLNQRGDRHQLEML